MDVAGDHMPGVSHRPIPAEPSTISPWYNWQVISALVVGVIEPSDHKKSPIISQWYDFHFSLLLAPPRWCKYCFTAGRGAE